MRRLVLLLCLLWLEPAHALDLYGSFSLQAARHTDDKEPLFPKQGAELRLNGEHYFGEIAFVAKGRARWNEAYANDAYSQDAKDAYRFSADWREFYAELPVQDWMVSVGWQQVVWGRADNLRVLDIVNPVDYREFVLPDLNDYRKASLMVKGERYIGDWSLQLAFLPFFEPTDMAVVGSEYEFQIFDQETLAMYQINAGGEPSRSLDNSEWAGNLSRSFRGLDLSFLGFYGWDDEAVYRQSYDFTGDEVSAAYLTPEYHRQTMLGTSAAFSLAGGFVARAELAYFVNKTYSNTELALDGSLPEKKTLQFLIGLDYLWRNWVFSGQLQDHAIQDWSRSVATPDHQPLLTFSATGQTFGGKLDSRFVYARYVDLDNDQLLQMEFAWKPKDTWSLTAGADLMTGQEDGFFGQFETNDRIWLEAKYNF